MAAPTYSFTTTLQLFTKTATGIEVPDDALAALGTGKRAKVVVAIGGYEYRSTTAVMGGKLLLPVSAEHRTGAGIAAGDTIEVTLTVDDAPREVEVPEDLAAALAAGGVRAAFDALAFSHRKKHVRSVVEAKKPETRANRVAKVVEKLSS